MSGRRTPGTSKLAGIRVNRANCSRTTCHLSQGIRPADLDQQAGGRHPSAFQGRRLVPATQTEVELMIRNNLRLLLAVPGLWALAGCESMNKTEQGAVGGGVLGGTAGALIGSTTGHTGAGAAIGAGLGAVSGGLIGNSIEESEHKAKAVP